MCYTYLQYLIEFFIALKVYKIYRLLIFFFCFMETVQVFW